MTELMLALPCDRDALRRFSIFEQEALIRERRKLIREHRDQVGDDRCWVDDHLLWSALDDTEPLRIGTLSWDARMERCRDFYEHRRAAWKEAAPPGAILDPAQWDKDLHEMPERNWLDVLLRIQLAIRLHRDVESEEGRPRTFWDDRTLYWAVLPEQIPPDFRLPAREVFLGNTVETRAGCRSFWASHAECGRICQPFGWGPCGAQE